MAIEGTHGMLSPHRTEPHGEDELVAGLEPDQVVGSAATPLPRMRVGRAAAFWFWTLRILVLLVSAMVVYTFVANLPGSG